ncbi:MAG: L-threonylcarbamoyladenylate synthase [Thermoplasmata archaeon]
MSSPHVRIVKARKMDEGWELEEEDIIEAVEVLKRGGLVVYPTDTLYGLGVDPYDGRAVERLYRVKQRPHGEPVSIIVSGLEEAQRVARLSQKALEVWRSFMPGPLTLILEATPEAPPGPISKDGVLGVRMPGHDVPLILAREFGPLTATSANLHGQAPPRTVEESMSQLGTEATLYVDAGPCPLGVESTVLDLTRDQTTIKREGALDRKELERYG